MKKISFFMLIVVFFSLPRFSVADDLRHNIEVTEENIDLLGLKDIEDPPCDGGVMIERRQTCDGGPETCKSTAVTWSCPGSGTAGGC